MVALRTQAHPVRVVNIYADVLVHKALPFLYLFTYILNRLDSIKDELWEATVDELFE